MSVYVCVWPALELTLCARWVQQAIFHCMGCLEEVTDMNGDTLHNSESGTNLVSVPDPKPTPAQSAG